MLANIFLTDRIEDCAFLSDEEKVKYADTYSLDKIIRLLLVHDLPEVYTGAVSYTHLFPATKLATSRQPTGQQAL